MNCYECAKVNDTIPALGVCQRCGVGLCLDHLAEAHAFTVGGTHYACMHEIPSVPPMQGPQAGIAAAARHPRAESAS